MKFGENANKYYVPISIEFFVVFASVTASLSGTRDETVRALIKLGLSRRSIDGLVWDHPPATKKCTLNRQTTDVE